MGLFDRRRREKAVSEATASITVFLALRDKEQLRSATAHVAAALDRATAVLGPEHTLTLRLRHLHGRALAEQGRDEEALREYRAVGDTATPDPRAVPERVAARSNLAAQLCMMERYAEGEQEAHRLLDALAVPAGPSGLGRLPATVQLYTRLSALNSLGRALIGLDRAVEAEQVLRDALAESAAGTEPLGNFQRVIGVNLAAALSAQQRHGEALTVLATAAAITDPTAPQAGASASAMARATALLGLGRHAEAAQAAREGLDAALRAFDEPHPRVRTLRALLAEAEPGAETETGMSPAAP